MKYILTKNDYEDIRTLIIISNSIWENYQILANLEIAGKKETADYQRTIEKLRSTIGIEPAIYSRLGTDFPKLSSIISYLESIGSSNLRRDRLEAIIEEQGANHLSIERILRKIDGSIYINKEMKQDMESAFSEKGLDGDEKFRQQFLKHLEVGANVMNAYMTVQSSIEEDKYACCLSILKKLIESPFYKDVRQQLTMMKYRIAFICGNIEEMMLTQNFEILSQVYLQARCVAQIQKQEEFITAMALTQSSVITIRRQTDILLSNYDNTVVSNKDKKAEALIRLCMLRASLLFLPSKGVFTENEIFHSTIDSRKYMQEHPQNSKIEKMIMGAYHQYKRDQCIPIQVSFMK